MPTEQPAEPYGELTGQAWWRLLTAARRKLERTGGALDGEIGLSAPSEAERRTVIGVTGRYRAQTTKRLTVPLRDLDSYLYDRYGTGLLQTLGRLHGPLRDRPAERADEAVLRERALTTARAPHLADHGWYTAWLERIAADGTLTRLLRRGDTALLQAAVRVLEKLPAAPSGRTPVPLPVLAEWATGDTKALIPGSPLEQLVLRALAQRGSAPGAWVPVPRDRAGRRALWESAGAVADDLASQVLVLNIGARGQNAVCNWLRDAADCGLPFRLTLHQLTCGDAVVPAAREIHVCENPAVLRAAAAALEDRAAALVCTEGIPSAACHKLLADAARAGARLRWRADFDWTGLRITAAAIERHGAQPWRMTTADYQDALRQGESTPLTGPPAPSPWDPALAPAMSESGQAVMEERLLPHLLSDLG